MSSSGGGGKAEKERTKQIQERCQSVLLQMLKDEDNKYCVDCDAKGPRWASWNLGIFLCIRCAGIHRNLGVHISKVKSVNLDSWTPEQVVSLQQMGNSRARAVYEANLPDSFRRPQNDSSLEAFIRAKYEQKKYIAKEWVPQPPPKVNWDKEIDEEIERQKKRKKSSLAPLPAAPTSDKKYTKSDVIPQLLPKPKSSVSPKMGRSTPTSTDSKPSNGAADLLGLDTSKPADTKSTTSQDDIFSSFFSAPQQAQVPEKPVEKPDLKTEEENFFNQAAPTEKEKSKLTKDSILALYSQTPNSLVSKQFGGATPSYNQFNFQQPQANNFASAQPNSFASTQPNNFTSAQPNNFTSAQPNNFASAQPNNFASVQPNNFTSTQPNNFTSAQPNNFASAQANFASFQNGSTPQSQFNAGNTTQSQFNVGSTTQSQFNAANNGQGQYSSGFNQFAPQSQQFAPQSQPFAPQSQQFVPQSGFSQFSGQTFGQNAFPNGSQQQYFGSAPSQPPLAQQFNNMSLGGAFTNAFATPPNANLASNATWQ